MRRIFPIGPLLGSPLLAAIVVAGFLSPAEAATARTATRTWTSGKSLGTGTLSGTAMWTTSTGDGSVVLTDGVTRGTWTTPWISTGFAAKNLLTSWNAQPTAANAALTVSARVRSGSSVSTWKTIADWRLDDTSAKRSSGAKQSDKLAWLNTDTITSRTGRSFSRYQVKVTLRRANPTVASPVVTQVAANASNFAARSVSASATTMTSTVDLPVPTYSQMIHSGTFAQWGGGGEAWCSPTSTAMVLGFWKTGPAAATLGWAGTVDPQVVHAARYTYDSRYRGTGNWPFNTAYASSFGLNAKVLRFTSLRGVEALINQGVPVIVSVAYRKGALTGAPVSSSNGHLIVVRGFTSDGSVIANDPAADSDATVRHIYDRAQFEKAWQGGSGGVGYVIRP